MTPHEVQCLKIGDRVTWGRPKTLTRNNTGTVKREHPGLQILWDDNDLASYGLASEIAPRIERLEEQAPEGHDDGAPGDEP